MTDATLQGHFAMEKGKRDSDRMVQDCLDSLATLLDGTQVSIGGVLYTVVVVGKEGKIMLDIRNLPGFDHIEFTVKKTGWGMML